MAALYSDDIRVREEAAREYSVFPQKRVMLPSEYKEDWQELLGSRKLTWGEPWPDSIARLATMRCWPEQAFGTANAACLLVWHRPGMGGAGGNPPPGAHIGPPVPVLGGIPHAQNVFWPKYHPSPSWRNLHKYLPQAFDGLNDPWSQIMIACLNPEPGPTGKADKRANMEAIRANGRLDKIVAVCKPRVIAACGKEVHQAIEKWQNRSNIKIIEMSHPLNWNGFGGRRDGPGIVKQLRAALCSS